MLIYAINDAGLHMTLEEKKVGNNVNFGWKSLIDKVNQGYLLFGKQLDKLEIWLNVSSEFVPNSKELYAIIDDYKKNFTMRNNNAWLKLQTTFMRIQVNDKPDSQEYRTVATPVIESLNNIHTRLKENTKVVYSKLFNCEGMIKSGTSQ